MSAPASVEVARERLAECRAIVGGERDPMVGEWAAMGRRERAFWLGASRLPPQLAAREWQAISGDHRAILKNNLYRAARRAAAILHLEGAG